VTAALLADADPAGLIVESTLSTLKRNELV